MKTKTKKDLRERILTLLRNQKKEERLRKSTVILGKLFRLKVFKKAKTVFFYASFDGEVDTFAMIREAQRLGKHIGLPRVKKKDKKIIPVRVYNFKTDMKKGSYGIKEPKYVRTRMLDLKSLDLVIVPGVAFDKNNHRLGRGVGYYDRFLKRLPPKVPTIGLAFDFQIIDYLPQKGDHDMVMSKVISN